MVSAPSAAVHGPRRTHGTNPFDCVVDQDFARCESEKPRGAEKCAIGFSIRSFTRFPWGQADLPLPVSRGCDTATALGARSDVIDLIFVHHSIAARLVK